MYLYIPLIILPILLEADNQHFQTLTEFNEVFGAYTYNRQWCTFKIIFHVHVKFVGKEVLIYLVACIKLTTENNIQDSLIKCV